MTVCIAAICQWQNRPMIVGASDRMLTSGDIEFEPPQLKVYNITKNIVALVAGDASVQITLWMRTVDEINKRNAPEVFVSDVAIIFADKFAEYRRNEAEREILSPLGFDFKTFFAASGNIHAQLVADVMRDLTMCRLEIETIITGIDSRGAHIYVIRDPGRASCEDGVGFAAIGIGENHAKSQFMFSRYTRTWVFHRALLLTYMAKKRAEAAPGVGKDTDVFFIQRDGFGQLFPHVLDEFDKIYAEQQKEQDKSIENANTRADEYVKDILSKAQAASQKETGGDQAPDQREIRGDSKES